MYARLIGAQRKIRSKSTAGNTATTILSAVRSAGNMWRYNRHLKKQKKPQLIWIHTWDKIKGYDHLHVYGIDKEVSENVIKDSKIPFDLLCEITASNIDLLSLSYVVSCARS